MAGIRPAWALNASTETTAQPPIVSPRLADTPKTVQLKAPIEAREEREKARVWAMRKGEAARREGPGGVGTAKLRSMCAAVIPKTVQQPCPVDRRFRFAELL